MSEMLFVARRLGCVMLLCAHELTLLLWRISAQRRKGAKALCARGGWGALCYYALMSLCCSRGGSQHKGAKAQSSQRH
jgi:hypothetical protein